MENKYEVLWEAWFKDENLKEPLTEKEMVELLAEPCKKDCLLASLGRIQAINESCCRL